MRGRRALGVRFETYTLTYDDVPASLNRGGTGSRRHWAVGYREKRRWEGVWAMLLLAEKAGRGMRKAHVDAVIEVEDRKLRDPENFRPAISKPLADALVKGGWLPDDSAEFFDFGMLKIHNAVDLGRGGDKRRVKGRTVVTLEAEYP